MTPTVTLRKRGKKWYVFVIYQGHRWARFLGPNKSLAEEFAREIYDKLMRGDLGIFGETKNPIPLFRDYGRSWLRQYAEIECKPSTVAGYRSILELRLIPVFGDLSLDHITRTQVKSFLFNLAASGLSRNNLRNALSALRGILDQAIEDGIIDQNPAARLGPVCS
jgi:Phage integrase, N-terminal SAM-like domain